MNRILMVMVSIFGLSGHVWAEDTNEKYFIAYNVSQNGMLSESLKQQVQAIEILDEIAVITLNHMQLTELASSYYQKPELQNKLRPIVKSFILSQSAGQLFDNATTELLTKIYNVDELKVIYQQNKSALAQEFIQSNIKIESLTEEYMQKIYQNKFDKTSANQLNQELEQVFMKLKVNHEIVNE